MVYKEVKKTIIEQNLSIVKLAKITGYSRVHLCNLINGHTESVRAKKVVAIVLGEDFNKLWGEPQE